MVSTDRIQGISGGLAIKAPCRAATTANIALAGLQTIDDVELASGDRVLVKDQSDTTENGIYEASSAGWTRAKDFDGANDVVKGTQVVVVEGTDNANLFFTVSSATPEIFGSSVITFSSSSSPSNSAADAANSAAAAADSADSATASAASAASSAAAAAAAVALTGTSSSSLTVGTGLKSLTTQTGEDWVPGHTVMVARTSAPSTTYMVGMVTAYTSGTGAMSVDVSRSLGSGTHTDWTLSLTAPDSATVVLGSVHITPSGTLTFEGTTDDAYETTLGVVDPTADRAINLPNESGTLPLPNVAQNWTAPQRAALTTDNDLSFDLSAKQNFKCTPTAGGALTFTNHADGLSGSIILVNGSNYAITAAATTKISATALARISASGTYRIDFLDDGTNAYCTASENLA